MQMIFFTASLSSPMSFGSHFQEIWCARRQIWCSGSCTQTWQPFTSKQNFWCIYINFQWRAWPTTFFMSTAMYLLWLGVETISGHENATKSIFILVFYFGRKCAQLVSVYIAPFSNGALDVHYEQEWGATEKSTSHEKMLADSANDESHRLENNQHSEWSNIIKRVWGGRTKYSISK